MSSPGDPDLQQYRAYLLRYALLQLRDAEFAFIRAAVQRYRDGGSPR